MAGFLRRTVSSLDKLFSRNEAPKPAGPRRRAPAAAEAATPDNAAKPSGKPDQFGEVEALLAQMEQAGRGSAGNLNMLAFDDVKAHFGDRWPALQKSVTAVIEKVIAAKLGPRDMHWPMPNATYLVVLRDTPPKEAEALVDDIRRTINTALLGKPELEKKVQMESEVHHAGEDSAPEDAPAALADEAAPEKPPISAPAERERPDRPDTEPGWQADENQTTPPPLNAAPIDGDALDKQIAQIESLWQQPAKDEPIDEASYDWQEDITDKAYVEKQIDALGCVYQPIWSVQGRKVEAMHCHAARTLESGKTLIGDAAVKLDRHGETGLAIDLLLLDQARQQSKQIDRFAKDATLLTSVHFETLASGRLRKSHAAACAQLPAEIRRRLRFELNGVPADLAPSRLLEMAYAAKWYSQGLHICLPVDWNEFKDLATAGVDWVGFSLAGEKRSEVALLDSIESFATRSRNSGLRPYARDLGSKNLVMAAVGFGIGHIAGGMVASLIAPPQHAMSYRIDLLHTNGLIT